MTQLQNGHRHLRVTIIGAGVSGILMGIKLQQHLREHVEFRIFEKSPELGGTWYENRYPGCACDVPSHLYQFSFAPNPEWTQFYATSHEIQKYLKIVVKRYNLSSFISYNSRVVNAEWIEQRGIWKTEVENQGCIESEILINAGGILNHPQMPDIPGLSTFDGPLLHTAAWDESVDLKGKDVAVIGAGASSVQLLPQIQPVCRHLDVYIRTPSWISPPVALPNNIEKSHKYTAEERDEFRENGSTYLQMRKGLENQFNGMFRAFMRTSSEQQDLRNRFEQKMKSLIKDENLQRHLIPSFETGCRRINPGEEYLGTLQEHNVEPIFYPIQEIVADGVVTVNGKKRTADVLIAATGFNTTFRPRFPIIGRDGINLQDLWESNPVSYLGIGVSGFPNYLMFLGPNTPISNGSLMGPLEATSDYIIRILRKVIRQRIRSFDVRSDVQNDFDEHTQVYMKDMVWTGACRSWFKNNKSGKVTALWPGSSLHYMQILAENRWEDFTWEYVENRFSHWGRGISWIEDVREDPLGLDESEASRASTIPTKDSDLSFYLWSSSPIPQECIE